MAEFRSVSETNYDCSRKKLIDQYKRTNKDVLAAVVKLTQIGEFDDSYANQTQTSTPLAQLDEETSEYSY